MAYQRGDIVEVPMIMPDKGRTENHPVVIVSNKDVHDEDTCYIGVMLTHSARVDQFSFALANEMFDPPMKEENFQARCHLITYILESHIIKGKHRNRMKANFVDQLVAQVNASALT